MSKKIFKEVKGDITTYFSYDELTPEKKNKTLIRDKNKGLIKLINNDLPTDFYYKGFIKVSDIDGLSEFGYVAAGTLYYIDKKAEKLGIKKVCINKVGQSKITQKEIILGYSDYLKLHIRLKDIKQESKIERSNYADNFFSTLFPKKFTETNIVNLSSIKRNIRNLSTLTADEILLLTPGDIDNVSLFLQSILKNKYSARLQKTKLINETKIKIDTTTLDNIIIEFNRLLNIKVSENKFGDFLKEHIFLMNGKYVQVIPEISVTLGISDRKVDFGLLDYDGYLDIYEIKLPSTKLLASTTDRGNYYWSTEAMQAIVQAEKYLYHAEKKSSALEADLKSQMIRKNISIQGNEIKIVKPKAYLIMGHSGQLDDDAKKEDFRILRDSFKNISIILYDEFLISLERIRNKFVSNN